MKLLQEARSMGWTIDPRTPLDIALLSAACYVAGLPFEGFEL